MADTIVDDDLWEATETEPDHAGSHLGHRVADILAKRRADLRHDDIDVLRRVVDKVAGLRGSGGDEGESAAGDERWRRRLMDVGHDPLKP